VVVYKEPLHWRYEDARRGLGDMLRRVNHIALIVRDVGYSACFYTEIIGFQQLRRPNFDRHGVWLTMGNIELHLIKGVPVVARGQHPADLIVAHISVEVHNVKKMRARLEMVKAKHPELSWRQNVSVPTAEASQSKFESDHTTEDGKIIQYFIEDPDGYWMEFCNCNELDDFCLSLPPPYLGTYSDDIRAIKWQVLGDIFVRVRRWIRDARTHLKKIQHAKGFVDQNLATSPIPENQVDEDKLANLMARTHTYGDLCQAVTAEDMRSLMAKAGNSVPLVLLMMRQRVFKYGHEMVPPSYLVDSKRVQRCTSMVGKASRRDSFERDGWGSDADSNDGPTETCEKEGETQAQGGTGCCFGGLMRLLA
jgi:catechol 2,3-dioxygenase-like lactoylglutathione lyase family enzyme